MATLNPLTQIRINPGITAVHVRYDASPTDVILDGTYRQLEELVYNGPPTATETIPKARRLELAMLYEEPHREPSPRHGFTEQDAMPGRMIVYMAAQGNVPHNSNQRATELLADNLYPFDSVHGHVVLVGYDPTTGLHIDLPARARRFEALR